MIYLSPSAVRELNRLKSKQSNAEAIFRLNVQPGGCAQFYYEMSFESHAHPGDLVGETNGIPFAIEAQSFEAIDGLTIDYSEDLMGGGFRFYNPNAAETCGCGNSFALAAGDRESA
jgi:iron-sulfur cluster assembly accessory protein